MLTRGKSISWKPARIPFTATDTINKISSKAMLNNSIEIYLETRIFNRLAGRISSSLMVPVANSAATISPAIMMVKIVMTIPRPADSFMPSHKVPFAVRISCSRW
ncbi:hypothetical protein D3C84_999950 [compost metagenome]